jgi:hypothetical protein
MIETRPATHSRTKSRATLNGVVLAITDLNPFVFSKILRERRKRDPRRAHLERLEQALKAAVRK